MANEKRLIDVNVLLNLLQPLAEYSKLLQKTLRIIETCPNVDAVEVVHARWENIRFITTGDGRAKIGDCSSCKSIERVRNYCPNCGAKMDGEDNGV